MIKLIKNLETKYPKMAKLIRYLISGGTAAFTDLLFLYVFTDLFHIWYLLSAILAFIIAFFVSFFLQKYWTFKDTSKDGMHKQMVIYFTISGTNLGINTLLMFISVDYIGLHYIVAQFIVSGLIACASYFLYKKFVFKYEKPIIL